MDEDEVEVYEPDYDEGMKVDGAELVVLSGEVTLRDAVVRINGVEAEVETMTYRLKPGQLMVVADVGALKPGQTYNVAVKRPERR